MLTLQSLTKTFGTLRAVDALSLEVRPGETLGLLGPNGAGKTTTIHMIVGALPPDGGSIDIDGQTDPSQPDVRRRLGLAPQALSLYLDLTGEENVAFFGRLYGLHGGRLKQRTADALELVGLTDRGRDRVKAYSGGMQRRLNLACAVVHEPKVLLLDEPTAGVDPQSRHRLFENITALKRAGCTILYTTHYMEEAQRFCDRVAIMDKGRLLDVDTVERLIARHGGQSVVEAEFEQPPPPDVILPGARDGTRLRIDTPSPLEEVARLATLGLRLASLNVHRPDLETVFLSLTGRSLRD